MRARFPFKALLLVPLLAACGENEPVIPDDREPPRPPQPPTEAYLETLPGHPILDLNTTPTPSLLA
jgi:hypothetical protein